MTLLALRHGVVLLVTVLLLTATPHAQDSLTAARELYASAQYDEALRLLDRMSAATSSDEQQSVDLYRALCLLAVGRRDEADRAIETMIARNPLYRAGDDLSPRTRAAFSDAKKRLLPGIVQEQYAEAKRVFDRKEFEAAASLFKRVIDALHEPDMKSAASAPPLSDLLTLATGFYDLSVKAIPPPPPPPAPVAPEPPVNLPPRIYSAEEPGIRPPGTITQDLPNYPGVVPPGGIKGIVEVVINEQGSVESATMIVPVTNAFDKAVLTAASRWRFTPALFNGTPVKFRKRIQINVAPPPR